jgi:hypothetical protein
MTLFGEALRFGGDPSVINAELAPTYQAAISQTQRAQGITVVCAKRERNGSWLVRQNSSRPTPSRP